MPLVMEQEGFEVWIYIYEEEKVAHVFFKNGETVIDLDDLAVSANDYSLHEQAYAERAKQIVSENVEMLRAKWEELNKPLTD